MTKCTHSQARVKGPICLENVLSRLNKVKSNGADRWTACCPAHDDCDPSLSIREGRDGKVLLHCWAGCDTESITTAIGLTICDLFPGDDRPSRPGPRRAAIEHERNIVTIGLSLLAQGTRLPTSDLDRLELACRRLTRLAGRK